jgi:hypothetical protein
MGIKRMVDSSFWTDNKTEDFTPEDKYFMVWLLTNPFTTQLGIYAINIKHSALQLGYSEDTVKYLLERFQDVYGVIIWSKETKEVAVKNYLRHSVIKGGRPVEDCIKKEMSKVKNKNLIYQVFKHIAPREDVNETVRKIINEYKNEIENENDNDNENDVSYHDSYDDSYHDSSKPKKVKHKYGEYNNVLLTDDELSKLKTEYSDYEERIERLSSYIASKGTKYKSHYATIRNWARKDKEQPKKSSYQESIENRMSVVDNW